MNYNPNAIFNFLSHEKIPAIELKSGDLAHIHDVWGLVIGKHLRDNNYNQGHNLEIDFLDGRLGLLPPWYEVKIIKRGIIDSDEIQKYIENSLEERRHWENIFVQEENAVREREIISLHNRLKELLDEEERGQEISEIREQIKELEEEQD